MNKGIKFAGIWLIFLLFVILAFGNELPDQKTELLEDGTYLITVYETKPVKIKLKAQDADGDPLAYIFEPPLDENGEWQTKVGDAGEYETTITVSDGKDETRQKIKIVVLSAGKPSPETKAEAEPEEETKAEKEVEEASEELKEEETVGEPAAVEEVVGNRAPVLEPLMPITVKEGEVARLYLDVYDPDEDELTVTIDKLFNENLEWYPGFNDAGTYNVKVTVSDGEYEVSQDVVVNVEDVDQAPIITLSQKEFEIKELETVSFTVDAKDPDGDEVTFTVSLPEDATFKNGVFTWTPSQGAVWPARGVIFNLLDTIGLRNLWTTYLIYNIKIKACSSPNACSEETVVIKVHDINRAPILEDIPDVKIKEQDALKINPRALDLDNDKVYFTFTEPLSASGSWTPGWNDSGSYQITVTASDLVDEVSKQFSLVVENNNRLPVFKTKIKGPIKLEEGKTIEFKVEAVDPDGEEVALSLRDPPAGAEIVDGNFKWTPEPNAASVADIKPREFTLSEKISALMTKQLPTLRGEREHKIIIEANDGIGTSTYEVPIIVIDSNQAPEITEIFPAPEITVFAGYPIPFNVTAVDPDGDALTYEWNIAGLTEPGATVVFDQPGLTEITVTVSDGDKSTEFTWLVDVLLAQ